MCDEPSNAGTAELPATPVGAPETDQLDLEALPGGPRAAIEAVLMVVEEPVSEVRLAATLQLPVEAVSAHLADLARNYQRGAHGFELRRLGDGWRIYSRHEFGQVVERFLLDGRRARLTQAALETLAVIAYRQPASRAHIAAVRGVAVDGVVRTLLGHGLIEEADTDPERGAVRYATSAYFLQRLGLASLEELPPLAPHLPDLDSMLDLTEGAT